MRLTKVCYSLPVLALVAVAACSAAGPATSGSGTASAQADVANVTLRIGDQAGTGAKSLLTAAGLISKLPFRVEWANFTSGPPMLQAMAAGSVDVGGVGNAPPVFAAAGGDQLALVAALQAPPTGSALLVPKGSAIHSVADLKGKRIAVAQGSSANYHLLTVLTKAGLSAKDITWVYVQPAAGLAAFTSAHVDAWDIWSPFIEQAEALDGATPLIGGSGYGSPYSFEVASRAALADPGKAAAIKDLIALLAQAHSWSLTHQQDWAAVWAKASGLSQPIMVKAAADSVSSVVPLTPTVVQSEQAVADAFYQAGLIPARVKIADFVAPVLG